MTFDLYTIISYAVAIVIGLAGSYFLIFKGKLAQMKVFIETVYNAIEDKNLTPEEIKEIIAAGKAVLNIE